MYVASSNRIKSRLRLDRRNIESADKDFAEIHRERDYKKSMELANNQQSSKRSLQSRGKE